MRPKPDKPLAVLSVRVSLLLLIILLITLIAPRANAVPGYGPPEGDGVTDSVIFTYYRCGPKYGSTVTECDEVAKITTIKADVQPLVDLVQQRDMAFLALEEKSEMLQNLTDKQIELKDMLVVADRLIQEFAAKIESLAGWILFWVLLLIASVCANIYQHIKITLLKKDFNLPKGA